MKKCNVYMRKCMSEDCTKHWDGSETSVFQLTKSTCAGYELGIAIYFVDKRSFLIQLYETESLLWVASDIWKLILFDTKESGNMETFNNERKKMKGFKLAL